MKSLFRAALLLLVAMGLPSVTGSKETIETVRYKIKKSDGNLWARFLGGGQVVRGEERPGTITFTFDDGPDHRTTPILLHQLDRFGIKAAFFVNAAKFHPNTAGGLENQAVLRDMHRRGHFIGSHTFSHKDITTLDEAGWRTEVDQVAYVIKGITGRRPWIFRPPFGRFNAESLARLNKEGYTTVMWNLDSGDWRAESAAKLFRNATKVLEENPKGGVMLFHDTNRSTVEAFPLIVEWIEERNARLHALGKPLLEIVGMEHYIRSRGRR
jgi:peptidoglycan/xylan/chitin deacetylase (PgdA/CDA1 family)